MNMNMKMNMIMNINIAGMYGVCLVNFRKISIKREQL
jgi:hypothetical protein